MIIKRMLQEIEGEFALLLSCLNSFRLFLSYSLVLFVPF